MSKRGRNSIPQLSKYRFLAGLQCYKRLFFECYHRGLAMPAGLAQQAIIDMGTRIGKLARGLCPGGRLVFDDNMNHEMAVTATEQALNDGFLPALFEAAFTYNNVNTRVDILARAENDFFDLIEVKSATRIKEAYISDVAIQLYVLEGCGINVRRACLACIDKSYVYVGGEYDVHQMFRVEDITEKVREFIGNIPELLADMRISLQQIIPPNVEVGRHCFKPYVCPFYRNCHLGGTEYPISELPRVDLELMELFEEAGIEDIREIPVDFSGLNPVHQRVRDCVINGRTYLDPYLKEVLGSLEYPIHFFDFETFSPALPLYEGTCPYQVIPFQWSNHIMDSNGNIRHEEFIYNGLSDPREHVARSLLETLGTKGSILTYSNFEARRISELAEDLPHLSVELLSLLEGRIVDLLELIREYCYHPDFRGSFSLKSVLPALVPDFSYDDLDIYEGGMASAAFAEIVDEKTSPERRESLQENLLLYCERDTEAMVRLYQALMNDY